MTGEPLGGLRNWAGNHAYGARAIHTPTSVEELQAVVRSSATLRPLGSRHSFNDIADTGGDLVSWTRMPRVFELDRAARRVTVDGGVRYGDLCGPLEAEGFALSNLASLPHISVAGACATATHGSGDRNGNLATAVAALEVVTADGEIVAFDREGDPASFNGAVVSLGALGVVTRLTLELQPTFQVRQDVYEHLPFERAVEHFDAITASADSVSLFTDWRGPVIDQVWRKRRVQDEAMAEPEPEFHGARLATAAIHPIRGLPAEACTEQLGVAGPWHERLPHFRMDHTPSSGDELQSEYVVARHHAAEALQAMDAMRDRFAALVQVSEVRTIAADDLWLSTANGRDSVAIHFTWLSDWDGVRAVLPAIEAALAPYEPRPHWGKVFTMPGERVRASYDRLSEFLSLAATHDPNGKFRNAYLDRTIYGGGR
jgi:xylitol oxidase